MVVIVVGIISILGSIFVSNLIDDRFISCDLETIGEIVFLDTSRIGVVIIGTSLSSEENMKQKGNRYIIYSSVKH